MEPDGSDARCAISAWYLRSRSTSRGMIRSSFLHKATPCSVANFSDTTGPYRVARYNLYPAAEVQVALLRGFSSGQGIAAMEGLADKVLPSGFGFEWTEIALQEKLAGNTAILAFSLAVIFVFLLLAALYESWLLPLAVILIVPMCILAAMIGVNIRGLDRNVLVEIALTSNDVILGISGKDHPFPMYRWFGVPVALATDDEGVSRINLTNEYFRATQTYGLKYADLKHMVRTSIEHSFLPGASLWRDPDGFKGAVGACSGGGLGSQTPTASCSKFLQSSEKAQQQWELERRFRTFEAEN